MAPEQTHTYRTIDVPVAGGDLRVGVWDPIGPRKSDVLLVHGVSSSHRAWPFVAQRLPGVRAIAPDLRGRGRSNRLTDSAGLSTHATDLTAILDALESDRTVVVGHSMGAFIAIVFADEHPDRVSGLVLVDGGLPLELPAGLSAAEAIRHVLGPTAERLEMRFESVESYFDLWRRHPAFANDWSPTLEDYLAYDLDGAAPDLRPATGYATLERDSVDQNTGTAISDALAGLRHPSVLLTAERGLLDQPDGLYAATRAPALVAQHPGMRHVAIAGVNHYTIVLSERGADAVAEVIRDQLAGLD